MWLYFAAWQRPWGTAAQFTVLPEEQAVGLPDDTSDELAASMGIPALTAHRCLFADGPLEGKTVLVHGGAGAVGHYAIELAKWRGATVATTVSSDEKAELAGRYRAGGMGYGDAKKLLLAKIEAYFAEARKRRKELQADPEYVEGVLRGGDVSKEDGTMAEIVKN